MKITVFTANQIRHNYFINLLSKVASELFVIQESRSIFPGTTDNHYPKSNIIKDYFLKVNSSERKLFDTKYISGTHNNINLLPMTEGDLKNCSLEFLKDFLKSDLYIVFGSSFIKGDLLDFLIKNKAINIHMGISPFYRGTDCNFWALYDGNPHLVGATIHLLSKGLDSGPILYHALSDLKDNPNLYTMSTVKSAFNSLTDKIKDKSIFNIKPHVQDNTKEIRYSKNTDFNEDSLKIFLSKKININNKSFDLNLYKDAYILKKI